MVKRNVNPPPTAQRNQGSERRQLARERENKEAATQTPYCVRRALYLIWHDRALEITMTHSGQCHCGAIRYELSGDPKDVSLCHCSDCRRCAGAPVVAWAGFAEDQLTLTKGAPKIRNSSGAAMRSFCAECGTGLFYRNADILPNIVEVQLATLDDPEALPPTVHIQTAEQIGWMKTAHELPRIERFPE